MYLKVKKIGPPLVWGMFIVGLWTGCAGIGHRAPLVQGSRLVAREAVQVQNEDLAVQAGLAAKTGRFDTALRLFRQGGIPEGVYAEELAQAAWALGRFEEAGRWFQTAGDHLGILKTAESLASLGLWTQARELYRAGGLTEAEAKAVVGRSQVTVSPVLAVYTWADAGDVQDLAALLGGGTAGWGKAGIPGTDSAQQERWGQAQARVFDAFCTVHRYDLAASLWIRMRATGQESFLTEITASLSSEALGALAQALGQTRDFDLAMDCAARSENREILGKILRMTAAQPWEKIPETPRRMGWGLLARAARLAVEADPVLARNLALRLGSSGRMAEADEILIRLGDGAVDRANALFPLALEAREGEWLSYYARVGKDRKNLARVSAFYEETGDWARALVFADLAKDTTSFQRLGAKVSAWHGKNHRDYLEAVSAVPVREEVFILACLYLAWTSEDRIHFSQGTYWSLVRESLGNYFADQQLRKLRELEKIVTRRKLGLKSGTDEKAVQATKNSTSGSLGKLLAEEGRIFAETQEAGRQNR